MSKATALADSIAEKWGPAVTKLAKGEGMDDFKALCAPGIIPWVIPKGESTAVLTVGDEPSTPEVPVTMTWSLFQESVQKDMVSANYAHSEAACMGVLGNRIILEIGRYNKDDELYMNAVSVLTVNPDGLIEKVESFGDPKMENTAGQAETQ
mmetsp:Transcript_38839/g.57755  ORF Transcript_38839/g.57755 Transcript_38839/m.57755 type:complete len:152 (-) Transcript_38839:82-537(-)|eukprot:CAMPEP_0194027446 /NCGR_PEP_ID=MMETSP0009_2-20130614/1595_1 /TAXON_ID=210454 /ORGANISM="Grammatophora oceanica, Strain CCMP 410" /LENGTH=151 /DNA_ID=CAMNT_0038666509 /DNA_START=64 /DNA_END=519 /DNA_ORIENTATION=+